MWHEICDIVELDSPLKVRYWWDVHSRNWIVQVLDDRDYEIDCTYTGTEYDAIYVAREYMVDYNT